MSWMNGHLEEEGLAWEAKVFGRPSTWGIRNSRVSKLYIGRWNEEKKDWDTLYSFERGSVSGEIGEEIIDKVLEIIG